MASYSNNNKRGRTSATIQVSLFFNQLNIFNLTPIVNQESTLTLTPSTDAAASPELTPSTETASPNLAPSTEAAASPDNLSSSSSSSSVTRPRTNFTPEKLAEIAKSMGTASMAVMKGKL